MSIRDRFKSAPTGQTVVDIGNRVAEPKRAGRPTSGKVVVSLRLEPEVVAKFRATGPGWQARMNDVLKAAKL